MSDFNQPLSGNEMPRFAGIASLFRLPVQMDPSGLDIALVGVPLDCGTSNRAGSRYGPRQIRAESVLVRPYGMATRAAPFDSFQIADTGDVALNTYNLEKSIDIIEAHFDRVLTAGAKTLYARDDAHRAELEGSEFKGKKVDVSRFKGLGEMDAKDLKETTMDPASRRLIRVSVDDDLPGETSDLVERLMGKKPELRFQYISENARFVEELDV
jgi:hypothetical protein